MNTLEQVLITARECGYNVTIETTEDGHTAYIGLASRPPLAPHKMGFRTSGAPSALVPRINEWIRDQEEDA